MRKAIIVEFDDNPAWVSCQSIKSNLIAVYEKLEKEGLISLQRWKIQRGATSYDLHRYIYAQKEQSADIFVFLEHDPSLLRVLRPLLNLHSSPSHIPRVIVHTYGDFMLQSDFWIEIAPILEHFPVSFVTASTRHNRLIQKCLSGGTFTTIPFPVNFQNFFFAPELRSDIRQKLGFTDQDFLFTYAGRLSIQKNELQLIQFFQEFVSKLEGNCHLLLAGPFDDLGVPYLGQKQDMGGHFHDFKKVLQKSSPRVQEKIHYLGNLPTEDLNELFNASDAFVSLSTHNDEDFGMAAAEAKATGLPTILTHWGGYIDIGKVGSLSTSIPVKLDKDRYLPQRADVFRALFKAEASPATEEQRQKISNEAQNHFSFDTVKKQIGDLLFQKSEKFQGCQEIYYKVNALFHMDPKAPFKGHNSVSEVYTSLYEDYGNHSN